MYTIEEILKSTESIWISIVSNRNVYDNITFNYIFVNFGNLFISYIFLEEIYLCISEGLQKKK
jgi:hypothetical protein